MEDIIVLKFGGSSVSNNESLKIVANKIIDFKANNKNVVVILSAKYRAVLCKLGTNVRRIQGGALNKG